MAFAIADRVWEQASHAGTGAVTLPAAAVAGGYQTFLAGWGASNSGWYVIFGGNQWEVGLGTINAGGTSLTRTTVFNGSSGAGVAVTFTGGVKNIISDVPAGRNGITLDGSVGAPAHSFANDTTDGMYRIGSHRYGFAVNGANLIDISANNVTITGIGSQLLAAGRLGSTTPAFSVNSNAASSITGLSVVAAVAGAGVALNAIGETNVPLTVAAAGSGDVVLSSGSGNVTTARPLRVTNATAASSSTTGSAAFSGGVGIANNLFVNSTAALSSEKLSVANTGAGNFCAGFSCNDRGFFQLGTGVSGLFSFFTQGTVANNIGTISFTTTATAYNTTSDGRLKPKKRGFDPGPIIDGLEPIEHNWLHEPDKWAKGFDAQAVHTVYPQAVTPGEGAPGDDGFIPWMIDYGKIVPVLVAEIKSLRARLAALEAK